MSNCLQCGNPIPERRSQPKEVKYCSARCSHNFAVKTVNGRKRGRPKKTTKEADRQT